MRLRDDVQRLIRFYPRVFFVCHQRHRRDPKTDREISAHQASILDHLDVVEPTLVGELADHMGVTSSTMSLGLDRLERGGLVLRMRDAGDKRRVRVLLTPAGARMKSAGSVLEPQRVRALLRRLSASERAAALHGLALLSGAAEGMMREHGRRRRAGRAS
jgi:DNA-binding MarR family transcriptional regulator